MFQHQWPLQRADPLEALKILSVTPSYPQVSFVSRPTQWRPCHKLPLGYFILFLFVQTHRGGGECAPYDTVDRRLIALLLPFPIATYRVVGNFCYM